MKARAELLHAVREFFHERGVLEVDTPALSRHATVDRYIESFTVCPPNPESRVPSPDLYLHTSPEFAMKRLLAAGSGPIYQLCHVFRAGDCGRLHNPEFMMLEWYRPGWDHHRLMDEVEELVRTAGTREKEQKTASSFERSGAHQPHRPFERITYRAAFRAHAGIDPFAASLAQLRDGLAAHGVAAPGTVTPGEGDDRDFWLHLWMGAVVGPRLGAERPCFVYDFPASQAALARIRSGTPPVAERFELFWKGMELANGFHELTDAAEQQHRFEEDREWRRQHGRATPPCDTNLIGALAAGMPDCAGVALGVDRLLLLLLGLPELTLAMAFDSGRA